MQCWGTLRFFDHWGLNAAEVQLDSERFVGKLTRSKTIGTDRAETMKLLVITKGAFVQNADRMAAGWQLLHEHAAFVRDYLLPFPSDGFKGCRR